ncbi:hypothetical protein V1264_024423 [Littorina saxatilis]|uniref:Uncharacterized protein n=2 Tax=Littorina saxatilis TaxID=31220 RepID=A0AAN9AL95_9CAEN
MLQLRCRVGQSVCTQLNWGYTGGINGNVVCCPTVSGQGFVMNLGLTAPDNCKCKQGTEEEYASAVAGVTTRRPSTGTDRIRCKVGVSTCQAAKWTNRVFIIQRDICCPADRKMDIIILSTSSVRCGCVPI